MLKASKRRRGVRLYRENIASAILGHDASTLIVGGKVDLDARLMFIYLCSVKTDDGNHLQYSFRQPSERNLLDSFGGAWRGSFEAFPWPKR